MGESFKDVPVVSQKDANGQWKQHSIPLPAQSDKHLHSTLILKFKLCLAKDLRTLFKRPGGRKTPLSGVEAVVLLVASVTVPTPALFAFASSPRGVIREDDEAAGFWPCTPPPLPLALPNDDDAIICCANFDRLSGQDLSGTEKGRAWRA